MKQKLKIYIRKYWHIAAILTLSAVYLILQFNRFFNVLEHADIDDTLQYELSKNISEGNWLGEYNRLTLIKGIGFPVWGALLHVTNTPLWLGNGLLMILACLALFYALKKLSLNRLMLVVTYGVILFNPMITARIYRDDIIPALIITVCAWAIGMFACLTKLRNSETRIVRKDTIIFTVIGVLSLPAWYYTREDATWLMPFILSVLGISYAYYLFTLRSKLRHSVKPLATVLLMLSLPFVVVHAAGISIATLNEDHYNRRVVNDYYSEEFEHAYATLSRVKSDRPQHPTVPVPYDTRQQIYKVSPAFNSLRFCLDGPNGPCEGFKLAGPNSILVDYEGGWLPHALRMAVENKGYYRDAQVADDYYNRLTKEVDNACESGKLKCGPIQMVSFLPISRTYIETALDPGLEDSFTFLLTLQRNGEGEFTYPVNNPVTTDKNAVAHYYDARYSTKNLTDFEEVQNSSIELIYTLYSRLNPMIFCLSILTLIGATFLRVRRAVLDWRVILVAWLLLATIFLRVSMLTYINIASFPTSSVLYYSAVYPLMFLLECLALSLLIAYIRNRSKV